MTNTTTSLIEDLVQVVRNVTGSDPLSEPCFEGVAIEPCADCRALTAVTTLTLGEDGDRIARVCIDCMWN